MKNEVRKPSREELEEAMDKRFSTEIYKKLKEAKVAVAGLGGIGSNTAVCLARSGIGHIHLVDFDTVDLTNLNRQAYTIEHLGRLKTEALKELLLNINPYLNITTETVKVTEENAFRIFKDYPIVCEAFDNPDNKAILVNTLLEKCPDMKIVSSSGMAGYGSSNEIETKRIMKNLYLCGDRKTDAYSGIGLMAGRVSICAGHEANMVIRLILGIEEI
ncbi:MAG: sulfur carrier protein ThiS adenylyltransferase ThiF [Clostridium sp.]|uniref:sulfur carrier protein ThiS adenylyltransferase ThiF n=1 Tax=Clostridium sp. DSM 8431 TaxID=1761781 RepID=UPI0008E344F9|nr:sulfur carrier protein ThiS adenylyltransferase ThiF [Clostridium sp. DSM 8431]MCR4943080.1 sulfur carrier protein ThiS adenylyltransferase ThiF [Clostridium sp.]SFU63161.1 sulfur carrier protein ThiS adenylyltransferase [Clostridium sp. DSM 8431]